jgi:hypothetical protein
MPFVRVIVLALCIAAVAAPAASAKGRLTIRLGDSTPKAGERFAVYVHTDWALQQNEWLRLVAVAPGEGWYDVVGVVTGASKLARASIPADGFGIRLRRTGTYAWRGVLTLPRAGRWRLVVPNGDQYGFMVPPPAAWMPWVQVHR